MIDSEELIQELAPSLNLLANTVKGGNENLPLSPSLLVIGLKKADADQLFQPGVQGYPENVESCHWPVSTKQSSDLTSVWTALSPLGLNWEYAKFGVTKGEFSEDDKFLMHTLFEGKARDANDQVIGIKATQVLEWTKGKAGWVISGWEQQAFSLIRAKTEAFVEVLDEIVPDVESRKRLRRSLHQEMLSEGLVTGKINTYKPKYVDLLDVESSFQYPSVSTVDINGDGWDDLFVSSRWGAAQLLENQQNGTFKDVTSEKGLLIRGLVNCALFVDFDNDGDKDLFVGRTQEPSLYFINDNGKYKPAKDKLLSNDLHLVVSASVADVNSDGLLDLYLCTFGPAGNVNRVWLDRYLPDEDRSPLRQRLDKSNRYLDMPGPRNILLMNRGNGVLERTKLSSSVDIWKNSYQATWADVDRDGDQDLYICNDFSPDNFFRNDTPTGSLSPVFTDQGKSLFGESLMSFGMGASWGDFDNDLDLDLYVSNMYSKAGKRITAQLDEVDPLIKVAANGNLLYENKNGKFKQLAGKGKKQYAVHKVGWSFGGQFADFNNDGNLDLYVPSGYYSAPSRIATQVDL